MFFVLSDKKKGYGEIEESAWNFGRAQNYLQVGELSRRRVRNAVAYLEVLSESSIESGKNESMTKKGDRNR